MEFSHVPVLFEDVIEGLYIKPEGIYVDGTLGGGGHSSGICERLSAEGTLIGIDRDEDAIEAAGKRLEAYGCKKLLVHDNYANVKLILEDLGIKAVDGALLDLGVSSFQLDEPERGFSYMHEAPLDMRMDRSDRLTAEEVVNSYREDDLARVIREYGEEHFAGRIAREIAQARRRERITTTGRLVEIIKKAIPPAARRDGPHPAKRTFQAIRIEVNDELGTLREAVNDFIDILKPGGRLAIISFHSLEDRIVKEAFQKRLDPCTCPPGLPVCVCGKKPDIAKITRKPVTADEKELNDNPRARSAKLRIIEKLQV